MDKILNILQTLPAYLMYVGTTGALLVASIYIYSVVTPYKEFALIKAGNTAAAISLGGTVIGLSIVLCTLSFTASGLGPLLVWAVVALIFQIVAFFVAELFMKTIATGIENGCVAHGVFLAAVSIAIGALNAGALS